MDSLRHAGGPLIPFVLRAEGNEVQLHRFPATTLEGGEKHARAYARQVGPNTSVVALAYDGYLTIDGDRRDAIFVAVQAVGTGSSDLYAQPYEFRADGAVELGNVKHIAVEEPSLLSSLA